MKKKVSVLLVLALCVTTMLVPDVGAAAELSVTKSITLGVGKSKTIKVKGAYVKSKKFKTTNKNVATVNKNGKVTAKQAGKCRITVTVKYKKAKTYVTKTFKCNVTVKMKRTEVIFTSVLFE